MPITDQQIQRAEEKQREAAHDSSPQIRLVAGPGTGKSRVIVERVRWLLERGVSPANIYVVSFTRASSRDLKKRICDYCKEQGQEGGEHVSVSTLHSLALRTLRMSRLLDSDPSVLDEWELEHIFDAEFSVYSGYTLGRCKDLRDVYEASLATEIERIAEHRLPEKPTQEEEETFLPFHQSRTSTYRCVLPGEIVRKCVDEMAAGTLNPAEVLRAKHLIVDEFQDLNETDQIFVKGFIQNGVVTFVAGDDDQSIYAFRFAFPEGIQTFADDYPDSITHELGDCFRCTPNILEMAKTLIEVYSPRSRIPKSSVSLYRDAAPLNDGVVHLWRSPSGFTEANMIAQSCRALIDSKRVPPRQILILLANHDVLFPALRSALEDEGVDFEPPRPASFIDTSEGRFVYGVLRIVCNPDDYIAHRLILGQLSNVGPTKCNDIVEVVLRECLNYKDIFHDLWLPRPASFSVDGSRAALERAKAICDRLEGWGQLDKIGRRLEDIAQLVTDYFGSPAADAWIRTVEYLPAGMSLQEVCDYLSSDTDEQQGRLLTGVYERLGLEIPSGGLLPPKVRMMTMHGAKGLDAQVVFIPGLEDGILPRQRQKPYPGDVQEAARLLYVSITRAKAACILSYAEARYIYGEYRKDRTRSEFVTRLGRRFSKRKSGLNGAEVQEIIRAIDLL